MSRRLLTLLPAAALTLACSIAAAAPTAASLGAGVERWFRAARLASVSPDPALALVARENSRALAEVASGEGNGVTEYLQFLLTRHQVRDAVVMALALRSDDEGTLARRIAAFLEERAPRGELSHYGVGIAAPRTSGGGGEFALHRGASEGGEQGKLRRSHPGAAGGREDPQLPRASGPSGPKGATVTLVLVRRRIEVLSVRAVAGRPLELCGRLRSGRRLRVLATAPAGRVLERAPRLDAGRFCVALGPAERGRHQVELMVEGAFGPEVAALFPLYVGVEPPTLPVRKLYPPESQQRADVETRLGELVARSRREAGLPPLAPSTELARAARRHSSEMQQRSFFGHRSPRRGDLAARLLEEELDYLQASENLVLSTGPQRAHDSLMASPAHRRNILDPAVTHLGVGVAVDRVTGLLYITECYARLPD